ncbi:MAG: hypothetical protein HOW73_48335 [Polyangiaceae bacterium]|nr:hypothetical protein [Polyangiaceae bacterium]
MALTACGKGSRSTADEPKRKPEDKSAPTSTSDAVAEGAKTDLSERGLPITIVMPACPDGSPPKVTGPMVKLPDNAADQIIQCQVSDEEALAGKEAFTLQVGLAKGKIGKAQVREDMNFAKFISEDPKSLEWETKNFGSLPNKREFILRVTAGGTEYACFPQFAPTDAKLYQAELAACRSIAAK